MKSILLSFSLLLSVSIRAQHESAFATAGDNKIFAKAVITVEEDIVKTTPSIEKKNNSTIALLPVDVVKTPVPERTITTKGTALWIDDPSIANIQNFYALHKYLPIGTMIKVINPMNNRLIEVKVVGKLPDHKEYQNITMVVSAATARQLNVLDEKFIVTMMIPVSAMHHSVKK